jgi:peptidoglycan/LPS O-acetylase OafA/YrhL
LYVQNWNLWKIGANYLSADAAPTLFQHFWSLSIEEQFYVVWPVLILLVVLLGKRLGRSPGVAILGAVLGVFVVSLAASVLLTPGHAVGAYYMTPTRVWELAAGGLLASCYPMVSRWVAPGRRSGGVCVCVCVCVCVGGCCL